MLSVQEADLLYHSFDWMEQWNHFNEYLMKFRNEKKEYFEKQSYTSEKSIE